MINVDVVRQRAVGLLKLPPGLMTEGLVMELLRGALVITVFLGVISLIDHEEAPPVQAAPAAGATEVFRMPPPPVKQVRVVLLNPADGVVAELYPKPSEFVAPADHRKNPVIVEAKLDPSDAVPIRQRYTDFGIRMRPTIVPDERKAVAQVKSDDLDGFAGWCAKRRARAWWRIKGVKHFCGSQAGRS
jgi:hypothetical protein